jgi:hypothetical protein
MIFIVNGERWCSLIEAVRREMELNYYHPIAYAPGTDADMQYSTFLCSYAFPQLPWNGALYYEWSK